MPIVKAEAADVKEVPKIFLQCDLPLSAPVLE